MGGPCEATQGSRSARARKVAGIRKAARVGTTVRPSKTARRGKTTWTDTTTQAGEAGPEGDAVSDGQPVLKNRKGLAAQEQEGQAAPNDETIENGNNAAREEGGQDSEALSNSEGVRFSDSGRSARKRHQAWRAERLKLLSRIKKAPSIHTKVMANFSEYVDN